MPRSESPSGLKMKLANFTEGAPAEIIKRVTAAEYSELVKKLERAKAAGNHAKTRKILANIGRVKAAANRAGVPRPGNIGLRGYMAETRGKGRAFPFHLVTGIERARLQLQGYTVDEEGFIRNRRGQVVPFNTILGARHYAHPKHSKSTVRGEGPKTAGVGTPGKAHRSHTGRLSQKKNSPGSKTRKVPHSRPAHPPKNLSKLTNQ